MIGELPFHHRWSIYETSVYMAWGDQRLAPAEISSARAIAEELDLDGPGLSPGTVLSAGPPMLADVGLAALSPRARMIAYATAAWVAFSDDEEHPAERAILSTLRHRMSIDGESAAWLESSALLVHVQGRDAGPRLQYRALLQSLDDVLRLAPPPEADAA